MTLTIEPDRVVVGEQAVGRVEVTNASERRMLPTRLEVPVGKGLARIDAPSLESKAKFDEIFVVPTERRSVIVLGPVQSVRGDPLGLIRRAVSWTEQRPLYVHRARSRWQAPRRVGSEILRDVRPTTCR